MIQDNPSLETPPSLVAETPLPLTEPWLIYAIGGGWGHLTRALALGRIAARERPVFVLCNSPYAAHLLRYEARRRTGSKQFPHPSPPMENPSDFTGELLPIVEGCYLHIISPDASDRATRKQVRQVLAAEEYECAIVDTFPKGLGGELADILPGLAAPRILVHRDINPDSVRALDWPRFVAENYQLVIVPGEGEGLPLSHLPGVEHTAPWLIRSAGELPDVARARTLLGLNPALTEPVVAVCAAGRPQELRLYGHLTRALAEKFTGVTVRCLAPERPKNCPPELWAFHWPAIECLPAADVVVGGAGYNTFYECAAAGVPLVAFAFERRYDRQALRADRAYRRYPGQVLRVESVGAALKAVGHLLSVTTSDRLRPAYRNGAADAVGLISQLVAERAGLP
ncbi:hypothetical protein [Kamptonema formosum]|uniref:hypothetical protein n=1 Tax=Kamptonema formosum TaxID=331992 RepID=UPI0018E2588E|nr:hypothetical protein [Oscillatoria sp. PCC 10802]